MLVLCLLYGAGPTCMTRGASWGFWRRSEVPPIWTPGGHLPGCVSSGLECSCPKASQRYEPPLGSMPGGMDQGDDRTHAEGESRNAPAILVQPPLDNAHLLRAPPFGPGHVSRFDLGPGRNAFMVPPLQPWLPAVSLLARNQSTRRSRPP